MPASWFYDNILQACDSAARVAEYWPGKYNVQYINTLGEVMTGGVIFLPNGAVKSINEILVAQRDDNSMIL